MIGTRVRRRSIGGGLLSLILVVLLLGPAFAGPGEPLPAEPLGSDSVRQRVRDRERMQTEYEEMRENRAERLAAARERVTATAAGVDEKVRVPAVISLPTGGRGRAGTEDAVGGAMQTEEGGASLGTLSIYAVFALIGILLFLVLLKRRGGSL